MAVIPPYALVKRNPCASKNIQCASYRQVDFAAAARMHFLKVLQVSCAARICHWDRAPLREFGHEVFVDSLLQAFDVGGVD
jgi:hypothetical protein